MIRILTITLPLLATIFARAEPKISYEKIVRYQDTVAGQSIEVSIHQGDYDFSGHKFTGGIGNAPGPAQIDGMEIAGTDGVSPLMTDATKTVFPTVREIRLKWGGLDVDVPKAIHLNLLNLTLGNDLDRKTIQFSPHSSGDSLLVQASGGDGGASYLVSLLLRKDGKHRQIYHGYWEELLPEGVEAWKLIEEDSDGKPGAASEPKQEVKEKPEPESEGCSG